MADLLIEQVTNTLYVSGASGVVMVPGNAIPVSGTPQGSYAGIEGNLAYDTVGKTPYFCSVAGTVSGAVWSSMFDSPAFTGAPTVPTAGGGTKTNQIASTAFVANNYAPLISPALSGTATAPTPASGSNNTQIATTAFVCGAIDSNTTTVNWASPGAIGSTTPNSVAATSLSANNGLSVTGGGVLVPNGSIAIAALASTPLFAGDNITSLSNNAGYQTASQVLSAVRPGYTGINSYTEICVPSSTAYAQGSTYSGGTLPGGSWMCMSTSPTGNIAAGAFCLFQRVA